MCRFAVNPDCTDRNDGAHFPKSGEGDIMMILLGGSDGPPLYPLPKGRYAFSAMHT